MEDAALEDEVEAEAATLAPMLEIPPPFVCVCECVLIAGAKANVR